MDEDKYNIVESDQSDLGTHLARWARAWQASFFILYTLVAVLALALYLLLARAVAMTSGSSPRSRETPVYFFLGLIAVTCLVEYAMVVQQLVIVMDDFNAGVGTMACRLFTYFTYGNKLMQVLCTV